MKTITHKTIEEKMIRLRNQDVILDLHVAELYGVATREINQAVKNNPSKFPRGYVYEPNNQEVRSLRSKILTANNPKSRTIPKVFTEKGLYMLATIIKGEQATKTTIAIIETYAKLRELSRTIGEMSKTNDEFTQKTLVQKSSEIVSEIFGSELSTSESETEIELNFAVLKVRHTVKRREKNAED